MAQQNDEVLAKQIYNEQKMNNFPGLVKECQKLIKDFDIVQEFEDSQMKKYKFKKILKKKTLKKNENQMKETMKTYKKIEDLIDEKFERKEYIRNLTLEQIRTKFRIRTKMVKMNMKNNDENWMCDSCETAIDNQSHVIWCPAYLKLREDLSFDVDLFN